MKAPSEEIYGKSTQGTYCAKVHSVSSHAVADKWEYGSIFIRLAVFVSNLRNPATFELIVVQGYPK